MAINTTVAAVVLAIRDHHHHNGVPGVVGGGIDELTPGERMVVSIFVMESARRFAGESIHGACQKYGRKCGSFIVS